VELGVIRKDHCPHTFPLARPTGTLSPTGADAFGGVRPSSAAATWGESGALNHLNAFTTFCISAPGDGRTPVNTYQRGEGRGEGCEDLRRACGNASSVCHRRTARNKVHGARFGVELLPRLSSLAFPSTHPGPLLGRGGEGARARRGLTIQLNHETHETHGRNTETNRRAKQRGADAVRSPLGDASASTRNCWSASVFVYFVYSAVLSTAWIRFGIRLLAALVGFRPVSAPTPNTKGQSEAAHKTR